MEKTIEYGIDREHDFLSLLKFALPTVGMMLISGLYSIVDSIFIANYIGTNALSSLNIVYPVLNLIIAISLMFSAGSNAIVAKKLGQKNLEEASSDFTIMAIVTFIIGVIISIVGIVYIKPLVYGLGSNDLLFKDGRDYLLLLLIFCIPYMLQLLFQPFYITDGRPDLGFGLTLISGVLNIIFDYLLIKVIPLGMIGAGIATGIGALFSGLYGLYYFSRKSRTIRFTRPSSSLKVIRESSSNGISEMISNLSVGITTFMFNRVLMVYLGSDGVASITIILYIQYFLMTVFLGFSLGISPIISYNYGAKNHEGLARVYEMARKFILISSALVFAAAILFRVNLINIFLEGDTEVYRIAENGFKLFSLSFIFVGINIFTSTFFTALGNGKLSGVISFLRSFIFIFLGLFILPKNLGVDGIWLIVPFAELLTVIFSLVFLEKARKEYHY